MGRFALLSMGFLVIVSASWSEPNLVVGNAILEDVVRDLAGRNTAIRNIIPGPMCPGHADMRPGDIESVRNGATLLITAWQQKLPVVTGLIRASQVDPARVKVIEVDGNGMIPDNQIAISKAVAGALCALDGVNETGYGARLAERVAAIEKFSTALKAEFDAAQAGQFKVVCSAMQEPFLRWAGFDVVATYGRPEDMSVAETERLLGQVKAEAVALVVDNLQSGAGTLRELAARDTGAEHVVLSNFPGGFENTETWERCMRHNADRLRSALARWKSRRG